MGLPTGISGACRNVAATRSSQTLRVLPLEHEKKLMIGIILIILSESFSLAVQRWILKADRPTSWSASVWVVPTKTSGTHPYCKTTLKGGGVKKLHDGIPSA